MQIHLSLDPTALLGAVGALAIIGGLWHHSPGLGVAGIGLALCLVALYQHLEQRMLAEQKPNPDA